MPKVSELTSVATQYPDLDDVPAATVLHLAIPGVGDFKGTKAQLRDVLGALTEDDIPPPETGAEIVAKIDAELGTDQWKAAPTEGAPVINDPTLGGGAASTTAAPAQASAKAYTDTAVLTLSGTTTAGLAARPTTAALALGTGAAAVGFDSSSTDIVASTVQEALQEIDASLANKPDADEVLTVDDAEEVPEGVIEDADFFLAVKQDGTYVRGSKANTAPGSVVPNIRPNSETSYAVTTADKGRLIVTTNASAVTIALPTGMPTNFAFSVCQAGAGTATVTAASGVTISGKGAASVAPPARYAAIDFAWIAADTYVVAVRAAATVSDVINPTVTAFSPIDGATNVLVGVNPQVTFSEDVTAGTGNVVLRSGGSAVETFNIATGAGDQGGTATVSGPTLTIVPGDPLDYATAYAIRIASTCIDDLAGNSYAGYADDTTWNFTTEAAPVYASVAGVRSFEIATGATRIEYDMPVTTLEDDIVLVCEASDTGLNGTLPRTPAAANYTQLFESGTSPKMRVSMKVMGASPDQTLSVGSSGTRNIGVQIVVIRAGNATLDGSVTEPGGGAEGNMAIPSRVQVAANCLAAFFLVLDDDAVDLVGPGGSWIDGGRMKTTAAVDNNCSMIFCYKAAGGSAGATVSPGTVTGGTDQWAAYHFGVAPE